MLRKVTVHLSSSSWTVSEGIKMSNAFNELLSLDGGLELLGKLDSSGVDPSCDKPVDVVFSVEAAPELFLSKAYLN